MIRCGLPEAAALTALFAVTGTQIFTVHHRRGVRPGGVRAGGAMAGDSVTAGEGGAGFGNATRSRCSLRRHTDKRHAGVRRRILVSLRKAASSRPSGARSVRAAAERILVVLAVSAGLTLGTAGASRPGAGIEGNLSGCARKAAVTGAFQVARTFLAYSFVSPEYAFLHLPEGIDMRDFRGWHFPVWRGRGASVGFLCLAGRCLGALWHWRDGSLAVGIAVALLLNMLFHCDFQFRGSLVYLCLAHAFPGVRPGGWSGALVRDLRAARWAYVGAVLALAGILGRTICRFAMGSPRRSTRSVSIVRHHARSRCGSLLSPDSDAFPKRRFPQEIRCD